MNGHTFGCFDEQGDKRQYVRTVEALEQYARKTYQFSKDFAPLFSNEPSAPRLEKPKPPPKEERDETDELIFKEEIKQFVNRVATLKGNLAAIWSVAIGQCTETMKAKLESLKEYDDMHEASDCNWLLKSILSITLQFDKRRYGHLAIMDASQKFLTCRQSSTQSVEDYRRQLTLWSDTIEHHGGSIVSNENIASDKDSTGKLRTPEERREAARQETLASGLLRGADPTRYGTLLDHLANQFASGRDEYPKDLTAAYSLLVHYKTPANARTRPDNHSNSTGGGSNNNTGSGSASTGRAGERSTEAPATSESAMTFTQGGGNTPVGSVTIPSTPSDSGGTVTTGASLVQNAVMMAQAEFATIDPSWILLDSQSTISVFNNKDMLRNIRRSPHVLRAITNGGYQDSNMIGDFPNLCEVWYNAASIANILSLAEVRKVCTVTMDSSRSHSMDVHRKDGTIMSFVEHPSGLYIYRNTNASNDCVSAYTLLSTVAEHKRLFSRRQIQQADLARKLYRMLGRPDEKVFRSILRDNMILNCPVTPDDAHRALAVYGPDVATLKGKMTRATAASSAPTLVAVPLPLPVLEHHRNVTLCVDFFFVQGVGFLHTISRNIGFRTVAPVADRTRKTILLELQAVIKLYTARGFVVADIHCDNEFECVRHDLMPTHLNVVAADGHVGEVERSIRTIKERLRSCVHGLPFRRLPKLIIRHMVADVTRCLNQFPWPNGISDTLSPSAIVTGHGRPDFNNMRIEFGAYAQVFDDNEPTNTPQARSLGAIALDPTSNAQGAYNFLSLATGARISRHRWTELPIPDTAIARVDALAIRDGQPLIQPRGLVVEWRPDHPIDESEYDLDYQLPAHPPDDDDFSQPADYDPVDPTELADLHQPFHDPRDPLPLADHGAIPVIDDLGNHEDDEDDENYVDDFRSDDDDSDDDENDRNDNDNHGADDDDSGGDDDNHDVDDADPRGDDDNHDVVFSDDEVDAHIPNQGAQGAPADDEDVRPNRGAQAPAYNLRERSTGNTRFRDAIDLPHSNKSYYPPEPHTRAHQLHQSHRLSKRLLPMHDKAKFAVDFILAHITAKMNADAGIKKTQMSFREGLRRHGKAAEAALMAEFAQLEDLGVYEAVNARFLTRAQRRAALRAINLIKEKRCGKIKVRTVADGRSQRSLYDKSVTASPTIATDALMLSIIIEAYEGRDVATADIAGAYLRR